VNNQKGYRVEMTLDGVASFATGITNANTELLRALRAMGVAGQHDSALFAEVLALQEAVEGLAGRLQPAVLLKGDAPGVGAAGGMAADERVD